MKYIIVGLGNFGSTLAVRLTEMGHEVLGVDARFEVVEQLKNKVSHVVSLDTSKASAYGNLPIRRSSGGYW
jgi:trk system potassium uptake protein TrkA